MQKMINAIGESCTAAAAVRGYNAIIEEDERTVVVVHFPIT